MEARIYEFEDFRLDAKRRSIVSRASGELIPLSPKAVELLICLIENTGRILTKDELLEKVWQDAFVEEANLSQTVFVLRKALGDEAKRPRFILTIPNKGYRFIAHVKVFEDAIPKENLSTKRPEEAPFRRKSIFLLIGLTLALIAVVGLYRSFSSSFRPNGLNQIKTLAVLPFEDLSADQSDRYLSISLADVLAGKFGELKQLTVRPTRAVVKYAESRADVRTIGQELQVDAVLDGRLQRDGNRLRVSIQLIRTVDNAIVWAESFENDLSNLSILQDSISKRAVEALALRLNATERERFSRRDTENPRAYEAYLRGRFFWNKRTVDNLQKAIGHFEEAVQQDPNFALAYAGLADCYILLPEYHAAAPIKAFPKAKDAIKKALELDPLIAEAHSALGYTQTFYDWDWTAAERSFERALELNPNYATAHQWYGEHLMAQGRFEESRGRLNRAVEIDPVSPILFVALAGLHDLQGDAEKEIEFSQKALNLDPNFAFGFFYLGMGYERKGMEFEASEAFIKTMTLFGEPQEAADEVRAGFTKGGLRAWWQRRLEQIGNRAYLKDFQIYNKALVQIRLGDKEGALESLERSFERRDHGIVFVKYEQRFEPLRDDPRFQDLLRRMGF